MTIGEIKRVIEDANLQDEAETNISDIIVKRTEYQKLQFETKSEEEAARWWRRCEEIEPD